MRTGGTAKDLRSLMIWCILLTIILVSVSIKISNIKKNYTELHRVVEENRLNIEKIINKKRLFNH